METHNNRERVVHVCYTCCVMRALFSRKLHIDVSMGFWSMPEYRVLSYLYTSVWGYHFISTCGDERLLKRLDGQQNNH